MEKSEKDQASAEVIDILLELGKDTLTASNFDPDAARVLLIELMATPSDIPMDVELAALKNAVAMLIIRMVMDKELDAFSKS